MWEPTPYDQDPFEPGDAGPPEPLWALRVPGEADPEPPAAPAPAEPLLKAPAAPLSLLAGGQAPDASTLVPPVPSAPKPALSTVMTTVVTKLGSPGIAPPSFAPVAERVLTSSPAAPGVPAPKVEIQAPRTVLRRLSELPVAPLKLSRPASPDLPADVNRMEQVLAGLEQQISAPRTPPQPSPSMPSLMERIRTARLRAEQARGQSPAMTEAAPPAMTEAAPPAMTVPAMTVAVPSVPEAAAPAVEPQVDGLSEPAAMLPELETLASESSASHQADAFALAEVATVELAASDTAASDTAASDTAASDTIAADTAALPVEDRAVEAAVDTARPEIAFTEVAIATEAAVDSATVDSASMDLANMDLANMDLATSDLLEPPPMPAFAWEAAPAPSTSEPEPDEPAFPLFLSATLPPPAATATSAAPSAETSAETGALAQDEAPIPDDLVPPLPPVLAAGGQPAMPPIPPALSTLQATAHAGAARLSPDSKAAQRHLESLVGALDLEMNEGLAALNEQVGPSRGPQPRPQGLSSTARDRFADANAERFVVFFMNGTRYGLPIAEVLEMANVPRTTPLPNAPEFIRGVANLRGEVLAVIDLRSLLALEAVTDVLRERMIVVRSPQSDAVAGLIVDSVRGLARLGASQIVQPSSPVEDRVAEFLQGVASHEDQVLNVLDTRKLFAAPEMVSLAAV